MKMLASSAMVDWSMLGIHLRHEELDELHDMGDKDRRTGTKTVRLPHPDGLPMIKDLFVYGTLLPGREPAPLRQLLTRMTLLGPASVAGSLYDLGPYPGALLNSSGGRVSGHVFEVPDEEAIWRALDAYEGFDPRQPDAGLFRREPCIAQLDLGGEIECQIYVYNSKPQEKQLIPKGQWEPKEIQ
jgi:gamma-glutamylcyclotransferase (GGCT)/AIG2-like uncharacterized protein YtfP